MQKQLVTISMPFLQKAEDYHEFGSMETLIKSIVAPKIPLEYKELFCDGDYCAVFYDKSNKPSNEDVMDLLFEENYTPEHLFEIGVDRLMTSLKSADIETQFAKFEDSKKALVKPKKVKIK